MTTQLYTIMLKSVIQVFLKLPSLPGFGSKKEVKAVNQPQMPASRSENTANSPQVSYRNQARDLAQESSESSSHLMYSPKAIPMESCPEKIQDLIEKKIGFKKDFGVHIPIITMTSHMNNPDTGENIDQYVVQLPPEAAVNLLKPGIGKRIKNLFESINPFAKKEFNRNTIVELKRKLHVKSIPNIKEKLQSGAVKAQITVNYDKNKDTYSVDVLGLSKRPEEFLIEDKKARDVLAAMKPNLKELKKNLLEDYKNNDLAKEYIEMNFKRVDKFIGDVKKGKDTLITNLLETGDNKFAVLEAMRDENEKRLDGPMGPKIDKTNLAYNLLAHLEGLKEAEVDTVAIKGKNLRTKATPWVCIDPDTKEISHGSSHSFISTNAYNNKFYSPVKTILSSLTELMFNGDTQISDEKKRKIITKNLENIFRFDIDESMKISSNLSN